MQTRGPSNIELIKDLYPSLDAQSRIEAAENLDRYLELALRIYERIKLDGADAKSRSLTAKAQRSRISEQKADPATTMQPHTHT